jgi:hypothetical protein
MTISRIRGTGKPGFLMGQLRRRLGRSFERTCRLSQGQLRRRLGRPFERIYRLSQNPWAPQCSSQLQRKLCYSQHSESSKLGIWVAFPRSNYRLHKRLQHSLKTTIAVEISVAIESTSLWIPMYPTGMAKFTSTSSRVELRNTKDGSRRYKI